METYLQTRPVARREGKGGFAFVGDEIWRHRVGDMDSYVSIKASTTFPRFHVCTVSELFRQVINTVLPLVKGHLAEAAPRLDILRL
jgi:hypothetical protein